MSDYWDHEEYGALEKKLEKQVATTRKWMALHDEAVEREATLTAEVTRLRVGLRFYANGRHMGFSPEAWLEWEDVSGEPPNWLQRNDSEHYEMIEDGTIGKFVLLGRDQDWSEHDDGEPPAIEGECAVSGSPTPPHGAAIVVDDDGKIRTILDDPADSRHGK